MKITPTYKVNEQGGFEQNLFPAQVGDTWELHEEGNVGRYKVYEIYNIYDLYRFVAANTSGKLVIEKKCQATELMLKRGILEIVDEQIRFREKEDERREEKMDENKDITMLLIAGGNN